MHEQSPVHYDADREVWDVFGYGVVQRVLTDSDVFSSDIVAADIPRPVQNSDPPHVQSMFRADPPDHARRRNFVAKQFTPNVIHALQPRFEEIADDLLETLAEKDRIPTIKEFAHQFPLNVLAELFGLPRNEWEQFKAWAGTLGTVQVAGMDADGQQALQEMGEYFSDLLAERADGDEDDLITLAATNDSLSHAEKIGFCATIVAAGHTTTESLITSAIWCFDTHNVTEAIRTGSIDQEQAIEEVLRYRTPGQTASRTVTQPVELGGKQIEAGETVTAWIGAANCDPEIFTEPTTFQPERSPNPHIAFGRGKHYCLGESLARVETDIALEALFDRFDRLVPEEKEVIPRHVLSPFIFT